MKSQDLHLFMRQHFMPFVMEHGFKRQGQSGRALYQTDAFFMYFGYQLSAGCNKWTGGELSLYGEAKSEHRQVQHAISYSQPRESVLPAELRQQLRMLALSKLEFICQRPESDFHDIPHWVPERKRYEEFIERYSTDRFFVPPFNYYNKDDVRKWCRVVVPFIPDTIERLSRSARNAREEFQT